MTQSPSIRVDNVVCGVGVLESPWTLTPMTCSIETVFEGPRRLSGSPIAFEKTITYVQSRQDGR